MGSAIVSGIERRPSSLAALRRCHVEAAQLRGLRDSTVRAYWHSLALVHPAARTAADLSRQGLRDYAARMLERDGDTARTRRTVLSTMRQARACFSRWAMCAYEDKGLIVPASIEDWRSARILAAPAVRYRMPPEALVTQTVRAASDLEGPMRVAWLLCYELGLRAGEAAAARWTWFRACDDGGAIIELIRREDWRPKGGERRVPVHPAVWAEIRALAPSECEWVLGDGTEHARRSVVNRDLATWMRRLGWDRATYPKAAHELRKLAGSRWYTRLGPAVAREWLGHASIATTCAHYAALDSMPAPLAPAEVCDAR